MVGPRTLRRCWQLLAPSGEPARRGGGRRNPGVRRGPSRSARALCPRTPWALAVPRRRAPFPCASVASREHRVEFVTQLD
ncbi:Ubiquitin Carboxyl-Terminal Hydrolase 6 [Manis pentadactyla]|nr:Ubiquitin Carboxyl-Terminal Hydrolase 6 [Manis pentadactyla]